MVNSQLQGILNTYSQKIKGQVFNIEKQKQALFQLIESKKEAHKSLLELIKSRYTEFQKKNEERVIKKTFTTFLYNTYNEFFAYFIGTFFGLEKDSLELKIKEKISDSHLIFEYIYHLDPKEITLFREKTEELEGNMYGLLFCTGYMFFITSVLGIIIRKSINENLMIDAIKSINCHDI